MVPKRIGILLVHGIGTQKPNEHLVNESRNIIAAIGEQVETITVSSEPQIADKVPTHFVPDLFNNMVRVEAKTKAGQEYCFEFNEVYWADLGEAPTLPRQISFWFWALSMWTVAGREFSPLSGLQHKMYLPVSRLRWFDRLMLAFLGALFFLGAGTVGLLNMIFDRLKLPRIPISDLLTSYVGDVMLYTQPKRDGDPTAAELGQPPRVEIRARMVAAMVEFAQRDYCRWYIVAHSLGTVVAYNGLMETEAALPNYLSRSRWAGLKGSGLAATATENAPDSMLPRRPPWLEEKDVISRKNLFDKLQGFVSYGSAIGKFNGMWPIIVPANCDEFVFPGTFKWINIYDWTDPVAGPLEAFTTDKHGLWNGTRQGPKRTPLISADGSKSAAKIAMSISYKAGPMWLYSHLQYLTYISRAFKRPPHLLALTIATWLHTGTYPDKDFEKMKKAAPCALPRRLMAISELGAISIGVWLLTAFLLWKLVARNWVLALADRRLFAGAAVAIVVAVICNVFIEMKIARSRGARVMFVAIVAVASCFGGFYLSPELRPIAECLKLCLNSCLHEVHVFAAEHVLAGQWMASLLIGLRDFLLQHVDAVRVSLGLLFATTLLIVILGILRWLFQPLPVQDETGKGGAP